MATPLTQTTGRRKEAVARARLRPGTGQLTINGRAFEVYFPTASQRMAVSEPLRVADRLESFDIDASIHGGGVSGQAGALRMAIARSLVRDRSRRPSGAQEGRAAHPRLASQGEQEVRPQEGPQGAAVHQALIGPGPDLPGGGRGRMRFGTDGVRGVANTELTPSFALDLGRAAARVLGATCAVVGGDTRRSTPMLEAALVAGLASEGLEVHRLGVAPTPAIAYHAARLGGIGAVVSASHNPYEDNGIKLFSPSGTKLPDEVEELIEAELSRLGQPAAEPGVIVDSWAIHDRAAYVRHVVDCDRRTLARRDEDRRRRGQRRRLRSRRRGLHARRRRGLADQRDAGRHQHQPRVRRHRARRTRPRGRRERRLRRPRPRRRRRPADRRRRDRPRHRRRPRDRHLRGRHALAGSCCATTRSS